MNNNTLINSEETIENIRKRMDKLPDNIQKILISNELADYFLELDRQNYLTMEQFDVMVETTHQVFLGMINPSVFLPLLSGKLIDKGLHPVIAKEIAQKIESKLIAPIRDDLEKIYHRFSAMEKLEGKTQEEVQKQKEEISKPLEAQETPPTSLIIESQKLPQETSGGEIKSMDTIIKPKSEEIAPPIQPSEEKPRRSFLSFLKFKQPTEEKPAEKVIIGKEEESKPVLEESSPWRISFEDVQPAKEKVVSEIELKHEEEIKPIGKIEKPVFEKEEIIQKEGTPTIPAETIPAMQAAAPPLEKKLEPPIPEMKTAEPMIEKEIFPSAKPLSEPPEIKHETINLTQNKPSLEEQAPESATIKESPKEEPEKIKEGDSQNVPAENVIDLRKLKF
ncbi:MAG: hypothetical protein N2692_00940 [Patescibacteria group bacterium]|jgi:hypothetical protein|nr:hypothetical protein [Patescibacteria group bacterium]